MSSSRGIESIDLWVKQATPDVPNDGKYHVMHKGKIVASFRAEAKAVAEYRRLIKEIGYTPPVVEALDLAEVARREDISRDMDRHAEYWAGSGSFRGGGKLKNVR